MIIKDRDRISIILYISYIIQKDLNPIKKNGEGITWVLFYYEFDGLFRCPI